MATTTVVTRAQGGIVPEPPASRTKLRRPVSWLLVHHTGATGWPKAGWTDSQHMAELERFSISAGKTWEYNYVITYPTGVIWEQAGDYHAAHCLNANDWSIGVQINQADSAGHPPQTIVDSFRWLRSWLVQTGQLAPNHQCVPHYRFRATACSSTDLAAPPGPAWSSPTGQGSLGEVIPSLLVPWSAVPRAQVIDAAFPANTPAQYKAAGIVGICRYVGPFTESKNTNLAETDAIKRAGLQLAVVRESTGAAYLGGYQAGVRLGQEARAHARLDARWPDERPVYTGDFDRPIPTTSFAVCADFMRGFNDGGGCGPQGAYAEGALLIYLKAQGLIRFGWQSMSTSFPGNSTISSATNLLQTTSHSYPQFDSSTYDDDFIITADWGQWPAPPGDDMSQADVDAVNAHTDETIAALWTNKIAPFLTAMLRGDKVGLDVHDNESVEGANTKAAAATTAALDAASWIKDTHNDLAQLADLVARMRDELLAALSDPGGLDAALLQGLLERTSLPSVPGQLVVNPLA